MQKIILIHNKHRASSECNIVCLLESVDQPWFLQNKKPSTNTNNLNAHERIQPFPEELEEKTEN